MSVRCVQHSAIAPIAAAWDQFVPRDLPHLRAGFLRAVEQGGVITNPTYLMVYRADQLVGVALTYTLLLDTMTSAPPRLQQVVTRIRRRFPRFMWKPMRVCGSPVSNAASGIHFDLGLTPGERRGVFQAIVQEVQRLAGLNQTLFFKDFNQNEVTDYAGELDQLGFFGTDPWAGTRLELPWPSFDAYLGALQKRYRRRIKKDLETAALGLEFQLLDQFGELAPTVAALYDNVMARAAFTLEKATPRFFAALSDFEQARLLVARNRATGEVVGFNVLLFGDTCMHNLYIGFDYAQNQRWPIYFSLVEHSLRLALERNCAVCYFGQDSYEFKARLGATPFPLTAYLKHRLWPIHYMLRSSREVFFPKNEASAHDVFQKGSESG